MLTDTIFKLAETLGQQLLAAGLTVTCAESCTGGGVAYALTSVAGSSQWFEGSLVTYANPTKQHWLGVAAQSLLVGGAVSEVVVQEMAVGAQKYAQANLSVAISGVAGPGGGSDDKPVGTVWFAWAFGECCASECCVFSGSRTAVREQAVAKALQGLITLSAN